MSTPQIKVHPNRLSNFTVSSRDRLPTFLLHRPLWPEQDRAGRNIMGVDSICDNGPTPLFKCQTQRLLWGLKERTQ